MYALRDVVLRGQPMQRLVDVLQRDWLYPHPERLVTFIGNHDNPRFMGEQGASAQKLKAAFSLLLTLRGLPQLYSGDEIAMPGGADPDNRRDFPGGFPGGQQNAFTPAGRDAVQQDVFRHVQSLLSLRREHPALQTGRQYHLLWDEGSYAFLRDSPGDRLLVVFNNGNSSHRTSVPLNDSPAAQTSSVTPLFPADAHAALQNGSAVVDVSAESVAILQLK
jgi:glycosidase